MLVARIHHRNPRWNDDWDNDDDYGNDSYGYDRGYYRHRGLLGGVVGLLDDLL
jgi:hypothetical protein